MCFPFIIEVTHVLRTMVFVLFAWLFFTDGRRSERLYLFLKSHLYLGLLCFFFLFFFFWAASPVGRGSRKASRRSIRQFMMLVFFLLGMCVVRMAFVCLFLGNTDGQAEKQASPRLELVCSLCVGMLVCVFTRCPREFRGCHKPPWRHTPDSPYRSSVWGRPSRS